MSRFFVLPQKIIKNKIHLDGQELHHIRDVMRLRKGDKVSAFDGQGKEYIGSIEVDAPKSIIIGIEKTISKTRKKNLSISLAQAIPKKGAMDCIITKATELGVDEIFPIITERTIVRPKLKDAVLKRERWERLAVEAAKQCGRIYLPKIREVAEFKDFIKNLKEFGLVIMPTLEEKRRMLKEALKKNPKNVLVIIGPEGDFTKDEVRLAQDFGAAAVSLGENVLRCDTAAIYVLSVLNYEHGCKRIKK